MSGSLSSKNEQYWSLFKSNSSMPWAWIQINIAHSQTLTTFLWNKKIISGASFLIPSHHGLNFRILCQSKYDYLILFYNNVFRLLVTFIILNNLTVIYQSYIHLKWQKSSFFYLDVFASSYAFVSVSMTPKSLHFH